jgi:pimeloyl-ACP methyl ester carboxylesterase
LPTVEANGVHLYYELSGGHGNPILLIHGSLSDHDNWRSVVPGLSENFRVLTYDRRGHSKSEKVTTQGSADEDATDASALLTTLGLAPAHVVGNSFGSIITLKLAAKQPSVFRSLIVHEPPLLDLLTGDPSSLSMAVESRKRAEAVIKTLESGDKAGGARLFVETLVFGPGQWEKLPPQLRETFINNADTWLDETRDPMGYNVDLGGLGQFRKPALLTFGGKSPPFFRPIRPIIEKVAKALPNSKLESYPNDGHVPHISNPTEFVRRVTTFAKSSG